MATALDLPRCSDDGPKRNLGLIEQLRLGGVGVLSVGRFLAAVPASPD